jgi:hypothetical protein
MNMPAPPPAIQDLAQKLELAGLTLAHSEYDQLEFGNALLVYRGSDILVRFVRDRGQWFVEVGSPLFADWFSPMIWSAFLDGGVEATETPSLDSQCAMVAESLDRIGTAATSEPHLLEELRKHRAGRAEARRGQANQA